MKVKELIEKLKKLDENKTIVISDYDDTGFDDIGYIYDAGDVVKIYTDSNDLFY